MLSSLVSVVRTTGMALSLPGRTGASVTRSGGMPSAIRRVRPPVASESGESVAVVEIIALNSGASGSPILTRR